MKKRIGVLFLLVLLCFAFAIPAAASDVPRFTDEAGLLTADQAASLNEKLDYISETHAFDVVIAVVSSLNGADPERYSCDFYDNNHFGYNAGCDGVVLMLNMEERDWVITSTGFGETAINLAARNYISDEVVPYLSAGDYTAAFTRFADLCKELVEQAQNGEPYKPPFKAIPGLIGGLIASFITASVSTGSMKSKLTSVRSKNEAADYVVKNSFYVAEARERFMYANVARIPHQTRSSTGSSGVSHSSSSGKF